MPPNKQNDDVHPEKSDDHVAMSVSRRRLLRSGINVGVSTALVWGFGADYVSSADRDSITYAMARSEPDAEVLNPRTKEVPSEWYESLRLAFEAQKKIHEAAVSPLVGSFVVPGSYDEPEASISVDATDKTVSEVLKALIEDVDTSVNIIDEIPPKPDEGPDLSDAYEASDADAGRIPGGVLCKADENYGTLAPALLDAESKSRFFATSNHVFGRAGTKETEHRGQPLSLPHEGDLNHIGNVKRGYPTVDLVQITPVNGYQPAPKIERASPSRVIGHYTKAGLADLMARGEPLTKIGAMTDRTTGLVKGIDGITCYTGEVCKLGQLKWGDEEVIADGDSGSVNFHEDPENPEEYLLVGGINNARTWWPGAEFSWGTAAYRLLDVYGLHF